MAITKLDDKYYNIYDKLFIYEWIKYKILCNNLLFTFVPFDNHYCGEIVNNDISAKYTNIIPAFPQKQLANYSFNMQHIIFNKLSVSHKHKLIITNISAPIVYHPANSKFDTFLIYNKSFTAQHISGKLEKYKLICNAIYSSHNITEYAAALSNLKTQSPSHKYSFISCHYGFIEGLPYTAAYNMSLYLPLILPSLGIAFKHLEVGGDLILFMTIINIHIPSVKKLLTILCNAFTNCIVEQDSINQNFLYQITEYYIKCSSYHGNITDTQMNELIQLGIDHVDLQYAICDVMQYYDRYSTEHPKQTLFYGNIETPAKISIKSKSITRKSSKRKSSKQPSIKTALFNSPSRHRQTSKSKSHHRNNPAPFTGDIKYLSDFELTDYAVMRADPVTQYKYMLLSNAIERIFIACFQTINNHIVNSLEPASSSSTSSPGLRVKPYILSQIKYSNMQKFVFMLEYNKIAYNKHILSIMKQEQNNLIETFYSLDNTIAVTLIKYSDQLTQSQLRQRFANFALDKPMNIPAMDAQYDRIDAAYQVKTNLLDSIGIARAPHIVQSAYEDFTRGLKNFINAKYAAGLPTKKGVSNAFLKLWEILTLFNIIPTSKQSMRTLHICEAPGQMILSMLHYISHKHRGGKMDYDWRSNSLNPFNKENQDIHGDTPIFGDDYGLIKKFPDKWLWGADNTGDITRPANIKWFREYVGGWGRVDVVVGDGGLNTGLPPIMLQKLDLAQVLMVLNCCSRGGKCIIKHFTPYIKRHSATNDASGFFVGFLYLYYLAFETVSLYKPYTSNPDSGEFYVIGQNFRGDIQPAELTHLTNILEKFELNATIIDIADIPDTFMMQIRAFIERLTDMNVKSEEKQNMLLTCYRYGKDANVRKYLQCDRFMDENRLKSILYPRYAEWIKKFAFL